MLCGKLARVTRHEKGKAVGFIRPVRAIPTTRGQARERAALIATIALLGLVDPHLAFAQSPGFETFFQQTCVNVSSRSNALAQRCAESGQTPNNRLSTSSEDSLDPTQLLSEHEAGIERSKTETRMIQQRLELRRDVAARELGLGGEFSALPDLARFGMILTGRGSWYDYTEHDDELGYDGTTASALAGFDYRFTDWLVAGLLFGYDRSDSTFDDDPGAVTYTPQKNPGESDSNSYTWTLFGTLQHPVGAYLDWNASGGFSDHDFVRRAVYQESTQNVPQTNLIGRGDTNGKHISGGGAVGYDYRDGAFAAGPYSRVLYSYQELDSYNESDETGSGLALHVDESKERSLTTAFGLRASYSFSAPFGVIVPQLRVEYEREWKGDIREAQSSFRQDSSGDDYELEGRTPDRNYANAGLGVLMVLPHGIQPYVDYLGVFENSDYDRHSFSAGVRFEL
jgi:outer membrane autotransporter protein